MKRMLTWVCHSPGEGPIHAGPTRTMKAWSIGPLAPMLTPNREDAMTEKRPCAIGELTFHSPTTSGTSSSRTRIG